MKKFYLFLFVLLININSTLLSQWVKTNIPNVNNVYSITLSGNNLFAGTDIGVYLTTNNGSSWSNVNNGLANDVVYSLAVIPNGTGSANIFAGTYNGVFISSNEGKNWTQAGTGLTNIWVQTFVSIPNGAGGANIIAGTYGGGSFISTNNGSVWTPVNEGLTGSYVNSIALNGTNLFAGTDEGVYLSTNNGTTWTGVNSGQTDFYVNTLAVNGTNLFAGTNHGVFLSTNNGSNWKSIGNVLQEEIVNSLLFNGTNLFAGTGGNGVFLSTNNGTTWASVNDTLQNAYVNCMAVIGSNLFIGNYYGDIYKRQINEMLTGIANKQNNLPTDYSLQQNYPNPFNPTTVISYKLPAYSHVMLNVYDVLGREVATLVNEYKPAGNHKVEFNAGKLTSGVYLYRINTGSFVKTMKMILMK